MRRPKKPLTPLTPPGEASGEEAGIGNLLSCGVTSQEISCVKSGLSTEITQNFSPRQPIHIYKEGTPMGLLLGGEGAEPN